MIPKANLPRFVSCNGRLLPPQEATVSILSPVIYGAFGVYESIQLWDGVCFHLNDHLRRLERSAALIDLPLAGDHATVRRWLHELIDAHVQVLPSDDVKQATIRLFAIGPATVEADPEIFIWLEAPRILGDQEYAQGVGAVTFQGERAIPQSKSLNTLVNTLARQKAAAANEHEGLLVDRNGCVREGASSNLFVVQKGKVLLPPNGDILEGVTLEIVLEQARQAQIGVIRQPLPMAEVAHWDEAFITSTSRHVLPLVRLDSQSIGDGRPGPLTQELHRRFETYFIDYVEEEKARTGESPIET